METTTPGGNVQGFAGDNFHGLGAADYRAAQEPQKLMADRELAKAREMLADLGHLLRYRVHPGPTQQLDILRLLAVGFKLHAGDGQHDHFLIRGECIIDIPKGSDWAAIIAEHVLWEETTMRGSFWAMHWRGSRALEVGKDKPYPGWVCERCWENCGTTLKDPSRFMKFELADEGDTEGDHCDVCQQPVPVSEAMELGYPVFQGFDYPSWTPADDWYDGE